MTEPDEAPIVNPNQAAIHGLRDIADLLAMHPELPPFFFGTITLRAQAYTQNAMPPREALARLARALGDAAIESANSYEVEIQGEFSGIKLRARIPLTEAGALQAPPPTPPYEPIIPARGAPK